MGVEERDVHIFESLREFDNKYPSKLYKCFWCGKITADKYVCSHCGRQSNNLFGLGFLYKILADDYSELIFEPLEVER